MPKNIFIDITQLEKWQGKLTGIPRVMDELASRYSDSKNVVLVSWSHSLQQFELVSYPGGRELSTEKSSHNIKQHKIKRVISKISRKSKTLINSTSTSQRVNSKEIFLPKKSDTIFILWGEWADDTYISRISKLHDEGIKIIQVAYDMLPLVTPQFSGHSTEPLRKYATSIYPISSLILAISKHTAKDVSDWLIDNGLYCPKIEVFRLGDDFNFAHSNKPKGNFVIKKDEFILTVGTVEIRKNHAILYYAYKLAKQRNINLPKLVILGRIGWQTENIYELMTKDPEVKDQFIFIHNASDEELSWLYENCKYSIYPSFYEGWGLPVAESVSRGVPCIASNSSSIPEIAGKLIDYFNPLSPDECLEALQLYEEPKYLARQKEALKQYSPTTWDECYSQVNKFIRESDS